MSQRFYERLLCLIVWLSEQIFPYKCCNSDEIRVEWTVEVDGIKITGDIKEMELREGQKVSASASLKTAAGNDAAYQTGSAVWTSSDPAVASVEVDATNELAATIHGLNGAANTPVLVTFTADGDPDADQTRDVVATLDVVVTQGEAVVAEITAGTPEDETPAS